MARGRSKTRKQEPKAADPPEVRLDKWLQVARIFKTRSQAGEAIDGGRVKMDGRPAKAGRIMHPGDRIEVSKGNRKLVLEVRGLAPRPIPAAEARELYVLHEEHETLDHLDEQQREYVRMMHQLDRVQQASRSGRPTKKERREITRARGKH